MVPYFRKLLYNAIIAKQREGVFFSRIMSRVIISKEPTKAPCTGHVVRPERPPLFQLSCQHLETTISAATSSDQLQGGLKT